MDLPTRKEWDSPKDCYSPKASISKAEMSIPLLGCENVFGGYVSTTHLAYPCKTQWMDKIVKEWMKSHPDAVKAAERRSWADLLIKILDPYFPSPREVKEAITDGNVIDVIVDGVKKAISVEDLISEVHKSIDAKEMLERIKNLDIPQKIPQQFGPGLPFTSCLRRLFFPKGLAARHRFALVLLCLMLTIFCGHAQKANPSVLYIDDYGLHYKGDTLRPGQDTTRWIEVLGPPSRVVNKEEMIMARLIWDDLGIAVETGNYLHDKRIIYQVLFFFCNLKNCEEGVHGSMFDHFSSGYTGLLTKKMERKWRKEGTEEELIAYSKKKNDPSNYIYTYSTLRKIYLNGTPINRDAKIETLNPIRKKAGLSQFRFGQWPFLGTHGVVVPENEQTKKTYPGNYRADVTTKPTSSNWDLVIHYGGYYNLLYLMMVVPY